MNGFFIKAEIWGKTRYWNEHDGLHAGTGKLSGYSEYKTEYSVKKQIDKLKAAFSKAVVFTIISHDELPFIKKQIIARKHKEKQQYSKKALNVKK